MVVMPVHAVEPAPGATRCLRVASPATGRDLARIDVVDPGVVGEIVARARCAGRARSLPSRAPRRAVARGSGRPLRVASDSRCGLDASISTRAGQRGLDLPRRLVSGFAVVNDGTLRDGTDESPFGGVEQSGIGRVDGEPGLRGYRHVESIVVDHCGGCTEAMWFLYSHRKRRAVKRALRWM